MPPRTIQLFAIAYLASTAVAIAHAYLTSSVYAQFSAYPGLVAALGNSIVPIVLGLRIAIPLGLTWLIVRRASKFGKWALAALFGLKTVNMLLGFSVVLTGAILPLVWMAGYLLNLVAMICLFTPEARGWFSRKGKPHTGQADVFE